MAFDPGIFFFALIVAGFCVQCCCSLCASWWERDVLSDLSSDSDDDEMPEARAITCTSSFDSDCVVGTIRLDHLEMYSDSD